MVLSVNIGSVGFQTTCENVIDTHLEQFRSSLWFQRCLKLYVKFLYGLFSGAIFVQSKWDNVWWKPAKGMQPKKAYFRQWQRVFITVEMSVIWKHLPALETSSKEADCALMKTNVGGWSQWFLLQVDVLVFVFCIASKSINLYCSVVVIQVTLCCWLCDNAEMSFIKDHANLNISTIMFFASHLCPDTFWAVDVSFSLQ